MNIKSLLWTPSISFAIALASCGGEKTTNAESQPETTTETVVVETKNESLDLSKGEAIFKAKCIACHQVNGQGIEGTFPPLAGSDYLIADKQRAVKEVLAGKSGEVTVNGKVYNQVMPPNVLTNEETVDVMNYVLNSWGNKGGTLTVEEVKSARNIE
ncbi:MAG: hypothetical protein A2033_02270 [Bacteroidetes bacterium GWA2_31_9]|nr:MAG: hypothetical protein A2033_02270 [Bacteroidetes bacterium GWA2_31_9]